MIITSNMKAKETKIKIYLDMIRPYVRDLINDRKTGREWKIQSKMRSNFISHKDSEETRTMYTMSRNIEIMWGNETE